MYSSDKRRASDDELRATATNEKAAPITATNEEERPITDPTPVLNATPLSNTPATTNPAPVTDANPLSNTTEIVAVLHDLGFTLSLAERRRSVDEKISCLLIGPLRQLAACFASPTPDQRFNQSLTSPR